MRSTDALPNVTMAMIAAASASGAARSADTEHRRPDRPRRRAVDGQDQDDEQDVGALEQDPARTEQLP